MFILADGCRDFHDYIVAHDDPARHRAFLGYDARPAATKTLTAADVAAIEAAVPEVSGTRYPEPMMAHLDSEKPTR